VQEYTHRISGKRITTVGVMHAATDASWSELIDFLKEKENQGAAIHLEGVQEAVGRTDYERASINTLTSLMMLGKKIANLTGLTYQTDAFANAPRWEKHDVTKLDVVQKMSQKTLKVLGQVSAEDITISPRKALWSLRNMHIIAPLGNLIPFTRGIISSEGILHQRNRFAVSAALDTDRDVVLVWGAAHLPGMDRILRDAEYDRSAHSWRLMLDSSYEAPGGKHKVSLSEPVS